MKNKNRFIDYSSYNFHYYETKNVRKKEKKRTRLEKILTTALTIKNSQGRSIRRTPCFSKVASISRDIVTEQREKEGEEEGKAEEKDLETRSLAMLVAFAISHLTPT